MTRALSIIFFAELLLGAIWTVSAAMATGAGGLAVFGLFVIIYALFAICALIAAWAWWKYPEDRKRAAWIMVLPVIFWFLPTMIRWLAGGALSTGELGTALVVLVALALIGSFFAPRKAVAVVPKALLRSNWFNALVVAAVVLGWLFMFAVIVFIASGEGGGSGRSGTGEGLAMVIILVAIYLVGLGTGSFVAMAWAWLGLRGGVEGTPRKWHIAQIVVALPGFLIGVAVFFWLLGQR